MDSRAVVFAALLAGCQGPPTIGPDPDSEIERSFTVAPGDFAEANLRLAPGDTALGEFDANGAMAWDVHDHVGGDVHILSEGVDRAGALSVTADAAGIFSMLWENQTDAPIELDVMLTLPISSYVYSWYPP
jgi:hypothetical protein